MTNSNLWRIHKTSADISRRPIFLHISKLKSVKKVNRKAGRAPILNLVQTAWRHSRPPSSSTLTRSSTFTEPRGVRAPPVFSITPGDLYVSQLIHFTQVHIFLLPPPTATILSCPHYILLQEVELKMDDLNMFTSYTQ